MKLFTRYVLYTKKNSLMEYIEYDRIEYLNLFIRNSEMISPRSINFIGCKIKDTYFEMTIILFYSFSETFTNYLKIIVKKL